MRILLFAFSFFFSILSATSQEFSSEVWHNGYLVTSDGDSVKGLIKYELESNIVQLIKDNVVKTYSSHKVFYFQIYDQLLDNYRQFYSIPYKMTSNYEVPIIFEVLYEGPLSLLAREAVVQESISNATSYWGGGGYIRQAVKYSYFFLDKRGTITSFSGKKVDLLTIMSKHQTLVKRFIKENRLNIQEVRDLIRTTAFYNSI